MPGKTGTGIDTALTLVGLGLVMGFSPTSFGIELRTARRAPRVWRRVATVVTGVASAATLLGALMSVLGPVVLRALPDVGLRSVLALRWLDLLAGALLVLAGGWRWLRSRRPPRPPRTSLDLDRPVVLLLVVFGESLVSTTGPATMYLVVRAIATTPFAVWPLDYAVFLLGLAAPYVVLGLLLVRFPAANARQPPWVRHQQLWRQVTSGALVVAGLGLTLVTLLGSA